MRRYLLTLAIPSLLGALLLLPLLQQDQPRRAAQVPGFPVVSIGQIFR